MTDEKLKDNTITGEVIEIFEPIVRTNWRAQTIVIKELATKFAHTIAFELSNDFIDKYHCEIGEKIIVHFNIQSRKYQDRYYTNVYAWKIEKIEDKENLINAPEIEESQSEPF